MQSTYRRILSVLAFTFPPSRPRRIHIYGQGLRSMVQVKNINSKYTHWVTNFPATVQYILRGRQTTVRACCLWVQRLKNTVMYKCSYFEQHKHSLAIKFIFVQSIFYLVFQSLKRMLTVVCLLKITLVAGKFWPSNTQVYDCTMLLKPYP